MTSLVHVQSLQRTPAPAASSLSIAVLTISDPDANARDDQGLLMAERLLGYGHSMIASALLPDNEIEIQRQIQTWIDRGDIDVVLMTDNSLLSAGDVPPSVVLSVDNGDEEIRSYLFHDPDFGFVSVVNILSARQAARYDA